MVGVRVMGVAVGPRVRVGVRVTGVAVGKAVAPPVEVMVGWRVMLGVGMT